MENHDELDPFYKEVARGNWDCESVVDELCIEGKTYELGRDGRLNCFKRTKFTIGAQMWTTFILHNITLKSHTSSTILHMDQLIWYILTFKEVDITQIILNKIWDKVNPKSSLLYLS